MSDEEVGGQLKENASLSCKTIHKNSHKLSSGGD